MRDTSSKAMVRPLSRRREQGQRGIILIIGIISLVFIIPFIGLSIDAGVLYTAKAQLQAAVDGASLAAARSLNLGLTTDAQAASAKQNAVNWFYANFPAGTWASYNTQMGLGDVNVFDDPGNAHLRNVTVQASTRIPTYFMRWLGFTSVLMNASGNASRRDVVMMMVLDRSGSMCKVGGTTPWGMPPCDKGDTTTPCSAMITNAKTFTGVFAAGRDSVGLVTFSDGAYVHYAPSTDFQTLLGYSNSSGSATGAIDAIKCNGGTGTAEAISLAYNELYKVALPGALNLVFLETDGLPNTVAYDWWDGSSFGIKSTSNCQDANFKMPGTGSGRGGWTTYASRPSWNPGRSMGPGGYMADIPFGAIGAFYSSDPSSTKGSWVLYNPWQTGASADDNSVPETSSAPGCNFQSSLKSNSYPDFLWLPGSDIFGNSVAPPNEYQSLTLSSGHVPLTGSISTDWDSIHAAALNATDNAAYRARTNATLPAYFFVIGLGGNGDPPDPVLLQRIANDSGGDDYNTPTKYDPCASEAGCVTYADQPQGTFVYAPTTAELGQAFQAIASQILRLSR